MFFFSQIYEFFSIRRSRLEVVQSRYVNIMAKEAKEWAKEGKDFMKRMNLPPFKKKKEMRVGWLISVQGLGPNGCWDIGVIQGIQYDRELNKYKALTDLYRSKVPCLIDFDVETIRVIGECMFLHN